MFLDVKRSSDYLKDHQKEYLFSEETVVKGTKMDLEWRMIIYLWFKWADYLLSKYFSIFIFKQNDGYWIFIYEDQTIACFHQIPRVLVKLCMGDLSLGSTYLLMKSCKSNSESLKSLAWWLLACLYTFWRVSFKSSWNQIDFLMSEFSDNDTFVLQKILVLFY